MSKENFEITAGGPPGLTPETQKVDEEERRLSVRGKHISTVDDVFGEIVDGGPNYRAVCALPQGESHSTDIPFRSGG